jgi:hypothetical protein
MVYQNMPVDLVVDFSTMTSDAKKRTFAEQCQLNFSSIHVFEKNFIVYSTKCDKLKNRFKHTIWF